MRLKSSRTLRTTVAAEEFANAADYIGALLVAEGVEGVSTDTSELVITLDEDTNNDEADDGEEWLSA